MALLPLNAMQSVTLKGVVKTTSGVAVDFQLVRSAPTKVEPVLLPEYWARPGGNVPSRPSSQFQAHGSLHLHLDVKERLGYGRLGCVYAADASPAGNDHIPPLAIKVVQGMPECRTLAGEAGLYEEMESLQGAVIPRCYGLFTGSLLADWEITNFISDPEQIYDELDDTSDDEPDEEARRVCILVLERLGKPLTRSNFVPVETCKELCAMLNDVARLGIFNEDLRCPNILEAPTSPPGLPSLLSPYRLRTYKWRFIDFETALKTNKRIDFLDKDHALSLTVALAESGLPGWQLTEQFTEYASE